LDAGLVISVVTGTASIVLAVVSIWLAIRSVSQSEASYQKTSETLGRINERSAGTEAIVGEHFQKLMDTMLKIVDSTTTSPEIRLAELEYKSKEQELAAKNQLFKYLETALASGDTEKLKELFAMGAQAQKAQAK